MIDIGSLTSARESYECAFETLGVNVRAVEERLNDHDLRLSGHVFIANKDHRRIQISLTEDDLPCAFIKTTGVNNELRLLQIVVAREDLMLQSCSDLFLKWIHEGDLDLTLDLASAFGY